MGKKNGLLQMSYLLSWLLKVYPFTGETVL